MLARRRVKMHSVLLKNKKRKEKKNLKKRTVALNSRLFLRNLTQNRSKYLRKIAARLS